MTSVAGGTGTRGDAAPWASRPNAPPPTLSPARAGAAAGRDSKMKLWDVVAVCLVLLHTASAFPLPAGKRPPEAPAEDRSLGRRRAPFALSRDCKNRSLPAGWGAAGGPPRTPTRRPHAPQASRDGGAASHARAEAHLPGPDARSVYDTCWLPRGYQIFCCRFSIPVNRHFPHHYQHRRKTHSCPLFSASYRVHALPCFRSPKALYLFGCAWLC